MLLGWCAHGGWGTTLWNRFSPSTFTWVLGVELGSSGLHCWVASAFAREPSHPLLVQCFNETLINKKLGLWCSTCGSSQTSPSLPPSYPRHLKTNFTNFKTSCDCAALGNRAVRRKSMLTHLKNTYTRVYFLFGVRDISV